VAGLDVAIEAFRQLDPGLQVSVRRPDGSTCAAGDVVAELVGRAQALLTAERVALNFLQRLSGIATLTRKFVEQARPARIFDTRKTAPGLRDLEKYAVRCGGGCNHRKGLHEGAMIKDNHIATVGDPEVLREKVWELAAAGHPVVIEAQTLEEALLFATFPVQVVMLDNFRPPDMRRAVRLVRAVNPRVEIEASGGVTLKNVRAVARTGVDRISVGALTHSAPAVDLSLEL
jgi:nicotinate-nucleotide pyrophosphorylase (carboxylating)